MEDARLKDGSKSYVQISLTLRFSATEAVHLSSGTHLLLFRDIHVFAHCGGLSAPGGCAGSIA